MKNQIYYEQLTDIIFCLKTFFICIFTYYTSLKISNNKVNVKNIIFAFVVIIINTILMNVIKKYTNNYLMSIVLLILMLSIIYSKDTKNTIGYSITINTISLSINYIIFFISLFISFFPNRMLNIKNDYISLLFINIIYTVILIGFFRIRRFKNGLTFIKDKINNEYFDALILNISIIIIAIASLLNTLFYSNRNIALQFSCGFILFSIIMFITTKKTLTMYYKHKMLVKDLNETKEELEKTKKDRDKLEEENLKISKMSHSISHKQKSLEHKLNKLMMNNEFADEIDVKNRIDEITKEYSKNKEVAELPKTEIAIIDDMLELMQSECTKNKIEFELQLSGNIYHMTNNFVTVEELEILLADHIKDAIIAIQHSDNINRSVLVRLGLIDEFYSLYIYDTGIEFEVGTLINLGTKAITTHPDEGGTGMGFLNTFDTLKKHKASMIINEIGKPCKDNYTKVIMIKFDGKDEFRVKSYRSEEIEQKNSNSRVLIDIK